MMSRVSRSVLRASCVAFCVAVALPVLATTYYVDAEKGDDGYDGTSPTVDGGDVGPKKTFEAGVALLGDKDTLMIAKGHYKLAAMAETTKTGLSFIGAGDAATDVLIDGQGACRALKANSGNNHVFRNLCFTNCVNGSGDNYGGALAVGNTTARSTTLSNVVFSCCSNLTTSGGALYLDGGRLTDCRFENNYSFLTGGAIYIYGNSTSYTLANVTFFGNRADGAWGSAIAHRGQYSYGHYYGCTFESNSIPNGSACFDQAVQVVSNCVFRGNSAKSSGIYVSANITAQFRRFLDCRFIGNRTTGGASCLSNSKEGLIVERCEFSDNDSSSRVIDNTASTIYRIADCGFTNNTYRYGCCVGEAIGILSGTSFVSNRCHHVIKERIAVSGGAVFLGNNRSTTVTVYTNGIAGTYVMQHLVTNCTFVGNGIVEDARGDNQSYARGGALAFGGSDSDGTSDYTVDDCVFEGNYVRSDRNYNGIDAGGAVWAPLGVRIVNSTFRRNTSNMAGGAFAGYSPCISNCVFEGNVADGAINAEGKIGCGGAIAFLTEPWSKWTNGVRQVVADCQFVSNVVKGADGIAIVCAQGHLALQGCTFKENRSGAWLDYYQEHGGVVSMDAGRCSWWSQKKSSPRYHGNGKPELAAQQLDIDRCIFDGNFAYGRGGALMIGVSYVSNNVPSPVGLVRNSLFCNNTVTNYAGTTDTWMGRGGAVYVSNHPIGIENCTFVGNRALGTNAKGAACGLGGAVYLGSTLTGITNCVFYGNSDNTSGTNSDTIRFTGNNVAAMKVSASAVAAYCYAPTTSLLDPEEGHHNILSDEDPFRSDDHTDLAVKKDCGSGVGLNTLDWMTLDSLDLGGKPRLAKDGTVDFGCYQRWFKPGLLLFVQ